MQGNKKWGPAKPGGFAWPRRANGGYVGLFLSRTSRIGKICFLTFRRWHNESLPAGDFTDWSL